MKKIFLGLVAITAITFTAGAQVQRNQDETSQNSTMNHERWGRHGGGRDGGMMKDLNLTDAQKQQMKSINEDFRSKMQELKKNDNITVKDFNARKEVLFNDRKSKVDAILTADQKNKLAQFKNDRGDRGQFADRDDDRNKGDRMSGDRDGDHQGGGRMNGDRMEKMQSELGLTSDQIARMKADRESFKAKADAIKNNTSLTDQQKKDQFMQLRKEREESFKSFLNPDQIKKLEEMKSKRSEEWKTKRAMKTT